tara:strand:- start:229 stop:675 length:447 start_codon:yes stop_codon:yes gene_type:complete
MTNIKVLPNDVLENIRQFAGNFRLCNGEFIPILNKNSYIFKTIENKIEQKQLSAYLRVYGENEDGRRWSNTLVGNNSRIPSSFNKYFLPESSSNWEIKCFWILLNKKMRNISYIYDKLNNILTFEYYMSDLEWSRTDTKKEHIKFVIE